MKSSARTIAILLVAIGIMALCPGRSLATGERHTHDGLFLRMGLGFGLAGGSADAEVDFLGYTYDTITLAGASAFLDFALGGNLTRNLALHWSLMLWSVSGPTVEFSSEEQTIGFETGDDVSANVGGMGIGLTYYFMPINIYLCGTLGGASGDLKIGDYLVDETDTGVYLRFMLGKEWWVGSNWALGLAGVFDYQSLPQETTSGEEATWKTVNFGLLFSATYD